MITHATTVVDKLTTASLLRPGRSRQGDAVYPRFACLTVVTRPSTAHPRRDGALVPTGEITDGKISLPSFYAKRVTYRGYIPSTRSTATFVWSGRSLHSHQKNVTKENSLSLSIAFVSQSRDPKNPPCPTLKHNFLHFARKNVSLLLAGTRSAPPHHRNSVFAPNREADTEAGGGGRGRGGANRNA